MWIGLIILPQLIAQLGQNYRKSKEWHEYLTLDGSRKLYISLKLLISSFRKYILFCTHFQPDIHAILFIFLNFALAELSTEVELPAQSTYKTLLPKLESLKILPLHCDVLIGSVLMKNDTLLCLFRFFF